MAQMPLSLKTLHENDVQVNWASSINICMIIIKICLTVYAGLFLIYCESLAGFFVGTGSVCIASCPLSTMHEKDDW